MRQTLFEKWKHRVCGAWQVLTGRAWVGYGNPMDWEYREDSWKRSLRCALEGADAPKEGK